MRNIVFDTSSVISIVTNNLTWVLDELKRRFRGELYIPQRVYDELVTRPLQGKMFKLEAMQILSVISKGTLNVINDKKIELEANNLLKLANNIFMSKDTYIKIVHDAEIEALALAKELKSGALVVDERTTRVLIEEPEKLARLLQEKLHSKVVINSKNVKRFTEKVGGVKVLRSVELMTRAYELGLLDKYLAEEGKKEVDIHTKRTLLDGVLWGLKLRGCAVSVDEINDILRVEGLQ